MNRQLSKTGFSILAMVVCVSNLLAGTWKNLSNFNDVRQITGRNQEIWVAALGGVMRYDTITHVKTFFTKEHDQLPSFEVERVQVNPQTQDVWIGTYDNGLARFNGTTWEHHPFPEEGAMLYEMKIAADGAVWSATSRGVFRFQNNQFTTFLSYVPGAPAPCWDFDLFPNGKILCGKFQPFILDPSTNQIQNITSSSVAYGISTVYVKDDSTYYFATDHGDLLEFHDTTEVKRDTLQSFARDIQINSNGDVFVYDGLWLWKRTNGLWEKVYDLLPASLTAFYVADNNKIWGADNSRLARVDTQFHVTNVSLAHSDTWSNNIMNLRKTTGDDILVVHSGSVRTYNLSLDSFTHSWSYIPFTGGFSDGIITGGILYGAASTYNLEKYVNPNWQELGDGILPGGDVYRLSEDNQGNLWMSGIGYVAKYDGVQFTVYDSSSSPLLDENLYIRDIHYDTTRNILWIGTYDGIIKYENNAFTLLNDSNTAGIQQYYDAIQTITEDTAHNIWFGTVYGGLLKYDGASFSTMLLPENIGNVVTAIAFIGDAMYAGDNLNGVWVYENAQWDSLNTFNSGLTSNYITCLQSDAKGNLYIGHQDSGLDIYNKNGVISKVMDKDIAVGVKAFPNPSNGEFILQWSAYENADVRIYSLEGKLARQLTNFQSGSVLDLTDETPGIYIADVKGKNIMSQIKLVVK